MNLENTSGLLDKIKNTTPALAEKLTGININSYWDLLLHIPIRYEDLTKVYSISEVKVGSVVQIEGEILSAAVINKRTKQLQVQITDGNEIITLLFFHFYPNYASQYTVGKKIRAFGEVKSGFGGSKSIIQPKIQSVNASPDLSNTFSPVYSTTNGLKQNQIVKLVEEALLLLPKLDILPGNLIKDLPKTSQAILTLHKLTPNEFNTEAHNLALMRLKMDELIAQQLILYKAYELKHKNQSTILKPRATYTKLLLDSLPYKLTPEQTKVLGEIYADIAKPTQMNRLLQGDVGSGKTIVATMAMLVAVENGYQAAIMAPTEILAEQHYLKTKQLLEKFDIKIVWLSGSLTTKQKKTVYNDIKTGVAQIIIGTHAIFQKDVEFNNLALIAVDEQHRFGVEQRLLLQAKGINPHQLMMSATPIPRTLAMSYYADLDISTIDKLPPGRTPIKTVLINSGRRHEVIKFISEMCSKNSQVYWVCPLIEESENLDLQNALNTFNELQGSLNGYRVGLIHGKLKPTEKAIVMKEFSEGRIQVLVATTVIEVGVDVPNASIMVIEHSERMGLSQLHQLRGRVGRGSVDSQCILLYQAPLGEVAKRRLKAIYENNDGFVIANEDLAIRGPGELLGQKQSGLPALRFANLDTDLPLLKEAKEIAKNIATKHPEIAREFMGLWFNNSQHFLKV